MIEPDSSVIQTAHLFGPLSAALVELLRDLPAEAWHLPTSAPAWSVKDVAGHLLDVDYRRISSGRDGHAPPPPSEPVLSYADLLRYLNTLNAEWVHAARRLSPQLLCDCLAVTGPEVARLMESADPSSEAIYAVAWAGQSKSPMWLDIGREYTERWHHQDQIREAVGTPPLRSEQWLRPALEISLLALPHAYRTVTAPQGTTVHLSVTGEAGGEWELRYESEWHVVAGHPISPVTTVRVSDLDLTRLLMHRIAPDRISSLLEVDGDPEFAAPLLVARAVMV